jgi:hypothetical protein
MPCHDCRHFIPSAVANKPRWGLDGYGYCKAAPSIELRARFFADSGVCWLVPNRYQERHHEQ